MPLSSQSLHRAPRAGSVDTPWTPPALPPSCPSPRQPGQNSVAGGPVPFWALTHHGTLLNTSLLPAPPATPRPRANSHRSCVLQCELGDNHEPA